MLKPNYSCKHLQSWDRLFFSNRELLWWISCTFSPNLERKKMQCDSI